MLGRCVIFRITKKLEERREQKRKGDEEASLATDTSLAPHRFHRFLCLSMTVALTRDKSLPFSLTQNEIKKEVERRKLGKEMLDFKRKQEDEKTKRILEERNREKAEEKAARERVRQQIAQVSKCRLLPCTYDY